MGPMPFFVVPILQNTDSTWQRPSWFNSLILTYLINLVTAFYVDLFFFMQAIKQVLLLLVSRIPDLFPLKTRTKQMLFYSLKLDF